MVKDKTFAEIVAWAMRNSLWESYHRDAARQLEDEYAGSGQGLGTSDINCRAVDNIGAAYRVLIEEDLDLLDIVTFTSDTREEEDGTPRAHHRLRVRPVLHEVGCHRGRHPQLGGTPPPLRGGSRRHRSEGEAVSLREIDRTVEKATDRGEVWVFVYGTLRPGCGNYERMGWTPSEIVEDVSLQGFRMYNLSRHEYPVYPVVTRGKPDEKIVGTLLRIPEDDSGLWSAIRMEVGAGYEVELVEVSTPGYLGNVVIFVQHAHNGFRISDGDWKRFCREYDTAPEEEFDWHDTDDQDLEGF